VVAVPEAFSALAPALTTTIRFLGPVGVPHFSYIAINVGKRQGPLDLIRTESPPLNLQFWVFHCWVWGGVVDRRLPPSSRHHESGVWQGLYRQEVEVVWILRGATGR
jgi:hypothetical protein